jgi:hypothetical protein
MQFVWRSFHFFSVGFRDTSRCSFSVLEGALLREHTAVCVEVVPLFSLVGLEHFRHTFAPFPFLKMHYLGGILLVISCMNLAL